MEGGEGGKGEGGSMCDTIQGGVPIYCTCTYVYVHIQAEEHVVYYGSTDKLYTERVAF